MNMMIHTPGLGITVTDTNKIDLACKIASSLMEQIYYEDDLKNDVVTVHKENECILEIVLRLNPDNGIMKGFRIQNKWFSLADAKHIVTNFICGQP